MKSISTLPPVVLQTIFGTLATQLGRLTQFIRRQGKLDPCAFARTFSLFLIRSPKASLQQLASELSITPSALSQRFQQPATAEFLRQLLLRSLGELSLQKQSSTLIPLLQRFKGVYPTDCTTIGLPDGLVRKFPGCGGGAKKDDQTSAVKVLLQINISTGQSTQLVIETGRTPDITMLNKLKPLPPGALEIADLGFFDTERLRAHNLRGVKWLTRLPARISVCEAGKWKELAVWLRRLKSKGTEQWEGELQVSKSSPLLMRVLVQRCPPKEAARRRRKLRERMKRKGKTPGWRQLELCDWWVLATNVEAQKLSLSEASELYRARWQIELVFKRWKSLGHVEVPSDLSAIRAECELYGRLLGVLVVDWLALLRGGPLSGRSVWQAWQVVLEMLGVIIWAMKGLICLRLVLNELADKLDRIPKQPKRKKRPSTRQRLMNT